MAARFGPGPAQPFGGPARGLPTFAKDIFYGMPVEMRVATMTWETFRDAVVKAIDRYGEGAATSIETIAYIASLMVELNIVRNIGERELPPL